MSDFILNIIKQCHRQLFEMMKMVRIMQLAKLLTGSRVEYCKSAQAVGQVVSGVVLDDKRRTVSDKMDDTTK